MNNKELVLKEMFGKNDSCVGYENICNKLIENGECITTIHASSLFKKGGIHNFVKQEPFEDGVDIIKLSIDKDEIYGSVLFKQYCERMVETKQTELNKLIKVVDSLQSFVNELSCKDIEYI